jgi:predicted molibdopterin-dependent oxidoreductase YjgC
MKPLTQIEILEQAIKICKDYSEDKYNLYKGRAPYTGKEYGRANDIVQGQPDGAEECADLLTELLEQVKLKYSKPAIIYDPNKCLVCGEYHNNGNLPCPYNKIT